MVGQIVIVALLAAGACAETIVWAARKIREQCRLRGRLRRFG